MFTGDRWALRCMTLAAAGVNYVRIAGLIGRERTTVMYLAGVRAASRAKRAS